MSEEMNSLLHDLFIHCMETGDQKIWEILSKYIGKEKN